MLFGRYQYYWIYLFNLCIEFYFFHQIVLKSQFFNREKSNHLSFVWELSSPYRRGYNSHLHSPSSHHPSPFPAMCHTLVQYRRFFCLLPKKHFNAIIFLLHCLFYYFNTESSGGGCCEGCLFALSILLVICTFPFSMCVTIKVSVRNTNTFSMSQIQGCIERSLPPYF